MSSKGPWIATDPTTGRPILMAPARTGRPQLTGKAKDGIPVKCPFCTGEEAQTPPEVDAVREPGTAPDTPGWTVRAFPNLYGAATVHEVVAEGGQHSLWPGDLDDALWADALALIARRIQVIEARPDVECAFFFKNVGRMAGASIAHNHSQILGLPLIPPRLELEADRCQTVLDSCPFCATLATAAVEGRMVFDNGAFAVVCPEPSKLPLETWVLPRDHDATFENPDAMPALAEALGALFRGFGAAFDDSAFNLYLHRLPPKDPRAGRFHWHLEAQPRTGFLAGLELGGDMYINAVPPAETAARLRDALGRG